MIAQNYNRRTNVAMEHNLNIESITIHPRTWGIETIKQWI